MAWNCQKMERKYLQRLVYTDHTGLHVRLHPTMEPPAIPLWNYQPFSMNTQLLLCKKRPHHSTPCSYTGISFHNAVPRVKFQAPKDQLPLCLVSIVVQEERPQDDQP